MTRKRKRIDKSNLDLLLKYLALKNQSKRVSKIIKKL